MKVIVNDKVIMLADSNWWNKGDIGRIVLIDWDDSYLICFDKNCTQEHEYAGDHAWRSDREDFELYRPNKLMKVE